MGSLTDPRDCSTLVNLMPSQFSQNSFIKCCYGDENPVEPIPDLRCPLGFAFNDILNVCDDLDECFEGQLHILFILGDTYSSLPNSSPWALIVFEKKIPPVSPY